MDNSIEIIYNIVVYSGRINVDIKTIIEYFWQIRNPPMKISKAKGIKTFSLIKSMKFLLLCFILSFVIEGCDYFFPPLPGDKVTVEEASKFLDKHKGDPDVVLMDVRSKKQYDSLNIESSVNIDFSQTDFPEITAKLNKDMRYLIIDENGRKSAMALELMKEQRFSKVHYIIGGINEWVKKGFPVQK